MTTPTIPTAADAPIRFDPPGAGGWMLDTTHHGRRPMTRAMQTLYADVFPAGMDRFFERMGLPLAEPRLAFVEGCSYIRIMGVGEPDEPKGEPPALLMKLLTRVHPELRRRNTTAARVFETKLWRDDVRRWFEEDRPVVVAALRRFQAVDLRALDDADLAEHVQEVVGFFRTEATNGFVYHSDLLAVGDLMAQGERWGIDSAELSALLRGASPATVEVRALLAPVARAVATAAATPESVAEVRSLGPDVAAAVDGWLDDHGWRLLSSDDIDAPTLAERPDLQLRALLAAPTAADVPEAPDPAGVRTSVPAGDRARFDEVLAEARHALTLRDDHVGVRWNWSAGLLRRALLEVGRRLADRGIVESAHDAIELDLDEVGPALAGTSGPLTEVLVARRVRRDAVEAAGPPEHLGEAGGEPPVELMPAPLARGARAALAMIAAMEGVETTAGGLSGVGIGAEPYTGRACVAATAADAIERVEPGDVLVVPFTSPSYNSLFPLVGAVITDEGGPMSHAAIMVREFGCPAVVGVRGASQTIADGATVTVDPAAGVVRVED